jgi:Family of unknown function (DUF6496)
MAKHKEKKSPMRKKHRGIDIEIEIEHKNKKKKHEPEKMHHKPSKKGKIEKVMHEFKHGELHAGSKTGPMVKNRKQAIAIAMNEARKYGSASEMKKK